MKFSIIAGMDNKRGIGKNNDLPWHLSADMKHFATSTRGAIVIMGRRTWESLPGDYRPLPGRINIVLTRQENYIAETPNAAQEKTAVLHASSLKEALEKAAQINKVSASTENESTLGARKTFVIGGGRLYTEAIQHPNCIELILTEIDTDADCDVFFPEIPKHFQVTETSDWQEENNLKFRFVDYKKVSSKGP